MSTQRNFERLIDDVRSIIEHGEDLVQDIPREVSDTLKDARKQFVDALDSAKSTCRRLEKKTKATARATDEVIHEKPYQFAGAALAVGVLIGILISRK